MTTDYGSALFPQHQAILAASGIDPEVARERGYVSVDTKSDLARRGFGVNQRLAPALLIPQHNAWGDLAGYQIRPDEPRMLDGRMAKYESPAKQKAVLDVPPRVRPNLGNPTRPLLITEGSKKADTAVSRGLDCVALLGVWAWRGKNDDDGLVALAAWEAVALNGRQVYIVFDSDVMTKPGVHRAMTRLRALLMARGAVVFVIYLPSGEAGAKVGLDDFLVAGHSTDDLLALATPEIRDPDGEAEPSVPALPPPPRRNIAQVEEVFRRWLKLKDLVPLRATLGAYAANHLPGDPVWLMLVGGSGRGKTEILVSLSRLPDVRSAASITEAALLSGVPRKEHAVGTKGGLLAEIGREGVLILKDFTSIIAMNRDSRGNVLAALREVYDGSWDRPVGADGGRTLHWDGKLGVLAGCTTIIDSAHAVTAAMGERFLTCRMPDGDRDGLALRALAHAGHEVEMRHQLTEAVAGLFVDGLPYDPHDMDGATRDRLVALVGVVAQSRSPVERDFQGEIELVLDSEAPTRIAKSLERLYAGLGAIGLPPADSWEVVARVALDCVPKLRRAVLEHLWTAGRSKTSEVAVGVAHPTKTAKRALEDLEAHGVVEREAGGEGKADHWTLTQWVVDGLAAAGVAARSTEPETSDGGSSSSVCDTEALYTPQHLEEDKTGLVRSLAGDRVAL